MTGDQLGGETALRILDVRSLRKVHFPSELFDEHAWHMMLVLFVGLANNRTIMEGNLIEITGAGEATGQRWITHLLKDGQLVESCDDDDVILTPAAISSLRKFLDDAKARESDDGPTMWV